MNIIELTLVNFFKHTPEKTIIIAYSGGVDSQVLLVALATLKQHGQLPNNIVVCHVNHGLSSHAQQWQTFAKAQCAHFDLPLICHKLNLKKQAQQSLEAIARDARYELLVQASVEPAFIVTGHHLNDQAETFLLALKRGSGLKGLSAMRSSSKLAQHTLARPLLTVSRTDIMAYAQQQSLDWIEDESNSDESFDRNFLRHTVLPELSSRWPSINNTIARSAEHCFEAQQLLDELAQQDLIDCQHAPARLSVPYLLKLSDARLKNLLRYFLSQHHFLMPSAQQLKQICQQLSADADKSPMIQLANCCLRRFKNELYLTNIYQDITAWQHVIDVDDLLNEKNVQITLPDDLGIINLLPTSAGVENENAWQASVKKPDVGQVVTIGFAHENPKCLPHYRQHSRPLKKVLQELGIAPWQRKRLPFLFYGNEMVAVIGYFVCQPYVSDNQACGFNLSWDSESSL